MKIIITESQLNLLKIKRRISQDPYELIDSYVDQFIKYKSKSRHKIK
jgi:hypothetical protein